MQQRPKHKDSTRGSVLVEYIMLNLLVVVPLVIAIPGAGKPNFNSINNQTESLGLLGDKLTQWYQKVVDGLCLPLP